MRVPTAASGLIPGKSAPLSTAAPAQAALRRLTAGRIRKLPGGGPPRGPSTAVCRHGAIPACSAGSTLRLRQAVAVSMRRPGRSWCTSVAAARQAEGLPGLRRAVTSELERLLGFDSALLEPLPPAVRTAPFLPRRPCCPTVERSSPTPEQAPCWAPCATACPSCACHRAPTSRPTPRRCCLPARRTGPPAGPDHRRRGGRGPWPAAQRALVPAGGDPAPRRDRAHATRYDRPRRTPGHHRPVTAVRPSASATTPPAIDISSHQIPDPPRVLLAASSTAARWESPPFTGQDLPGVEVDRRYLPAPSEDREPVPRLEPRLVCPSPERREAGRRCCPAPSFWFGVQLALPLASTAASPICSVALAAA
jgi:hypothetical protein